MSILKKELRYGEGEEIGKDTFEKNYGVTLYFYDSESIRLYFGNWGLLAAREIREPTRNLEDKPSQEFWHMTSTR